MIGKFLLVLVSAFSLDMLLIVGTLPLAKFAARLLVPSSIFIGPDVLWTYSLVIFTTLLAVLIFLLWTCESYYQQWFDFWDLLVTMVIVMAIIVYGRDMVPLGLIGRI